MVNEDRPPCNVPRETIKAVQVGVKGPLSNVESCHAAPFPPQDFCSPCIFAYYSHNTGSQRRGSVAVCWGNIDMCWGNIEAHILHTHTHRLRVNTCPSAALTLEEPPVSPGFLLCCAGPMGSKLETEGQEGEARISSLPSLLEEMSTATEAFQTGSGSHWKCLPCGPSFHQVTSSPPLPGSGSTTSSL